MYNKLIASCLAITALVMCVSIGVASAQQPPIKAAIVHQLSTSLFGPRSQAYDIIRGIEAAFLEANEAGGTNGRNYSLVVKDDQFDRTLGLQIQRVGEVVQEGENITGFLMVSLLADIAISLNPNASSFPVIAPWSIQPTVYEPPYRQVLHLRQPFEAEMNAMMVFGINSDLRCKQFVIAYSPFPPIPDIVQRASDQLVKLGLPPARLIVLPDTDQPNHKVQEAILVDSVFESPRAQCVVFWNGEAIYQAVENITKRPEYDEEDMFFLGPSISAGFNMSFFGDAARYKNLFFTQQSYGPDQTKFQVVQHYQKAFDRLRASGFPQQESAQYGALVTNPEYLYSYQSLEAYIAARFFIELTRRANGNLSHANILETAFRTRTFPVDDVVLGPFNDGCVEPGETSATGACWCTVGNKALYTSRVDSTNGLVNGVVDTRGFASPKVPLSDCVLSADKFLAPHFMIVLANASADAATLAAWTNITDEWRLVSQAAYDERSSRHFYDAVLRQKTVFEIERLANLSSRILFHAVIFPNSGLHNLSLAAKDFLVIAPLPPSLQFPLRDEDVGVAPSAARSGTAWNKNVIPLFPTIADLVQTAVAFAAKNGLGIDVVVDSAFPEAEHPIVRQLVAASLETYRVDDAGYSVVDSVAIANYARQPAGRCLIAISYDKQSVVSFLQAANTTTFAGHLVLVGSELILGEGMDAFNPNLRYPVNGSAIDSRRVLMASGLAQFVTGLDSAKATVLRTYITAVERLLAALASDLSRSFTSQMLIDALFAGGNVPTQFAKFGPFDVATKCSKGINEFNLLPVMSLMGLAYSDNTTSTETVFTFDNDGCGVKYTSRDSESFSVPRDAVIALLVAMVFVALVVFTIYKLCKNSERINMRRFVQSPIAFTALRILVQFLDMVTDAASCYVVITRNVDFVFTVLFTVLTALALIANVYEISTLLAYFSDLLKDLEFRREQQELLQQHNLADADEAAQQAMHNSHMTAILDKVAWRKRLAYASVFTLLFEDVPMCTMTTIALNDEPEVLLFVSLIVSAILLGTKLINLQDIIVQFMREKWSPSDDKKLEEMAGELNTEASMDEMSVLIDKQATGSEKELFNAIMVKKNAERHQELVSGAEKMGYIMSDLNMNQSEFYAIVVSILEQQVEDRTLFRPRVVNLDAQRAQRIPSLHDDQQKHEERMQSLRKAFSTVSMKRQQTRKIRDEDPLAFSGMQPNATGPSNPLFRSEVQVPDAPMVVSINPGGDGSQSNTPSDTSLPSPSKNGKK